MKLLRQNLEANQGILENRSTGAGQSRLKAKKGANKASQPKSAHDYANIQVLPLDWESSDLSHLPSLLGQSGSSQSIGVDVLLACDCIYNDALIDPFVRTCTDICSIRRKSLATEPESNESANLSHKDTVCIIAQQLRSAEVLEDWLKRFMRDFQIWRVPDGMLEGLGEGSGFVVHVGILKR